MKKVYDYETNNLRFSCMNAMYNLQLRGRIVCLEGISASGKTYMVSMLKDFKKSGDFSEYDASNIILVNQDISYNFDIDAEILVIVDNAEFVLGVEICEKMLSQKKTRYLVISRKSFNLHISPNYFCDLVMDNGVLSLKYHFNENGWF